jgi:hypothetical protein
MNGVNGGIGGAGDGGAGAAPDMAKPADEPHALGVIMLGESHAAGAASSAPLVTATFVPDVAATRSCTTSVGGCDLYRAPKCQSSTGIGTGCMAGESCAFDDGCMAKCVTLCTISCPAGQECYFPSPGSPACRTQETFDAGALAFAGTTVPITLYPPYSFSSVGTGAPFLAGAQLEVQGSGATGAGFDKFDEKFTATTFLQTSPSIATLSRSMVFGTGPVAIGWAPGNDSIVVTVGGAGGSATCHASDVAGTYTITRDVLDAVLGTDTTALTISVSRLKQDTRKNEHTKGALLTRTVQPTGWLTLGTSSTESTTVQGCGPGLKLCNDLCIPVTSDSLNCGGCGVTCAVGDRCNNSVCDGPTACAACSLPTKTGVCKTQWDACQADAACAGLLTCYKNCAPGATLPACLSTCNTTAGTTAMGEYNSYANCVRQACPGPCA